MKPRTLATQVDLLDEMGDLVIQQGEGASLELVRRNAKGEKVAGLALAPSELSGLADIASLAPVALRPPVSARAPGPSRHDPAGGGS